MARTRVAVLTGALRAVERSGTRRTTMADVASLGGVAKATVYNHFRTKADVLGALVEAEVLALGAECAQRAAEAGARDGLAEALEHASARLSEHRALRRVAEEEPEVLARLLVPGDGAGWLRAREAAAAVLRAADRDASGPAVEAVLRLVGSHLAWPADRAATALAADALARGLGRRGGAGDGDGSDVPPPDAAAPGLAGGLGWPG